MIDIKAEREEPCLGSAVIGSEAVKVEFMIVMVLDNEEIRMNGIKSTKSLVTLQLCSLPPNSECFAFFLAFFARDSEVPFCMNTDPSGMDFGLEARIQAMERGQESSGVRGEGEDFGGSPNDFPHSAALRCCAQFWGTSGKKDNMIDRCG